MSYYEVKTSIDAILVKFGTTKKNINQLMVAQGYAWSYYDNNREYLRLQAKAQQLKLGLWQYENPIHPKLFRKIDK